MTRKLFSVYLPQALDPRLISQQTVLWVRPLPSSRAAGLGEVCGPDFEVVQIGGDRPTDGLLDTCFEFMYDPAEQWRFFVADVDSDGTLHLRLPAPTYVLALEVARLMTCTRCHGFSGNLDGEPCPSCQAYQVA